MYPVLLTIGGWKLHANLAFFTLSCIVGVAFGIREAQKIEGNPSFKKINIIVSFAIGILLAYMMGRLNGGIFSVMRQKFGWKAFESSGLISFGVILGAFLYGFLVSKIRKFSTLKTMDLIALILPLSESIYRIGCILMGCCYGRETSEFGGMYLPEVHGVWAHRYPTQLILLAFNLILFLLLWRRRAKEIETGSQTVYYLLIYSAGRFLIDFLRGDLPMVGMLSYHQITSILIFGLTILVYLLQRKIKKTG